MGNLHHRHLQEAGVSRFEHYRTSGSFSRPYLRSGGFTRWVASLLSPFSPLIDHLPTNRASDNPVTLLDLGCGHGVFLAMAKRKRPDIQLIGLDLSEDKIAGARQAFDASNYQVRDSVKDIADFEKQAVDVITILDVLYLVPIEHWQGTL